VTLLPSAPIEAVRIINIRFTIYIGTDRVQLLSVFLKTELHRVLKLELGRFENILTNITTSGQSNFT